MSRKVLIFPGVGSHHVGMGKEFYQNFQVVRDTFEEASEVLKVDMAAMCFSVENAEKLNRLENSQTALLTLSTATYKIYMKEVGEIPAYSMGHSLGEYSALCCAGIVQFPETLKLVKERSRILNEVAFTMDGIMAWVINLDNKIVENVCKQEREHGHQVYVSAYDAPKQSSISGTKEAVMQVGRKLEKEGAIVYPLKLSGPFHSPLMEQAAEKFKAILLGYTFSSPIYPVIANYNARPYNDKNCLADCLSLQLIHPIRWQASVDFILKQGIEIAIELGPDRVLKHLMKNNTDKVLPFSLNNMKDLDELTSADCFEKT